MGRGNNDGSARSPYLGQGFAAEALRYGALTGTIWGITQGLQFGWLHGLVAGLLTGAIGCMVAVFFPRRAQQWSARMKVLLLAAPVMVLFALAVFT